MKTNLSFFVILFVAIVTFINDIFIYFFKLDYLMSLIISSLLITIIFAFLFYKKKIKIENYFNKWDLVFLVFYLVLVIIKIVQPDFYYDTANYHYYNQKYPFIDKINFDFLVAGGRVSDFVYPLADRMNYVFRFFLGIRLGAILEYFSIIIIFYQIKKILLFLKPNMKLSTQIFCSAFPISIPLIFRFLGKYYIDSYSIVFLFEAFYIGIKEKELFNKKNYLYYYFLIMGITIGVKISNLVLLIPIGLNIIYNNIRLFKKLKIRDYIICLVIMFLPFFPYGINNYFKVGNFFYPFLGGDKYYEVNDWKDNRFGVPNFLWSFIWPIMVSFNPTSGHDEELIYELVWAFGYVFIIINITIKIFEKNINTDLFRSELITFIFCILWANFLNGYCRYALIIPILFVVFICANFEEQNKSNSISNKILYYLQYISLIVIFCVTLFGTRYEIKAYIMIFSHNSKNIIIDNNYQIHIDGVWGSIGDTGGMISLLREEGTPIYNLENINIKNSSFFYSKYKEILKNKDIYIITSTLYRDAESIFEKLNEENFEVIEEFASYDYKDIPYISYMDTWRIYKVRYKE